MTAPYNLPPNRYLALSWAAALTILGFTGLWSEASCKFVMISPQIFSIVLFSAHAVIIIRVWSVWGRAPHVLLGLFAIATLSLVVEVVANLFVRGKPSDGPKAQKRRS